MARTPAPRMKRAYAAGVTLRDVPEWRWDWSRLDASFFEDEILNLFFEAGLAGSALPQWVRGWRFGPMPASGRSSNFREGFAEKGVSVMEVTDNAGAIFHTQDGVSSMFFSGEKFEVEGWLHFERGSDGEPLLVGARQIRRIE